MSPRPLNAIRSLRRQKTPPLTQRALGELVGVTQSDISAYERGSVVPELRKALEIASALGRPVEAVFYGLFEEAACRVGERRRSTYPSESCSIPPVSAP